MSHVLIAGCGDLGLDLLRRLRANAFEVTGLRRSLQSLPEGAQLLQADVTEPEGLSALAALKVDILVYCVAATEHSDEGYRASYVDGLRNVLQALDPVTLKHVFFVSSTSVYGQETDQLLDENSPTLASEFSGKRMLEAEALLQDYPSTILRFSGIYGPGRRRMIELAQDPKRWPARNGWTNRIHRDDGAAFILFLIEKLQSQQTVERMYLVTDKEPLPLYELLTWLAKQQQVDIPSLEIPAVAGNKRLDNQRMLASGYRFIYPDYRAGYSALLR
ncbi:NAD-dependent epimerase/dehydratase family protein [Methylobacillus gramineus]|uniref:NAD-dependent epimerase/dehydratase family protein n=1 Tax=Methylobacillus gramineus TaxID=755169 RepID=UPI001CFFBA24|nr:NAD-dependent epimerase/dehydratase family protein [Methylobacillus gramineus]MCB5183663.1 NAD-dependent epimerase/dehydratase family protein [Methylobacillus gramineus]